MEAVEDNADRLVVGAAHDLPCIAIIVYMPSPCERFEADTQAAPGSQFAKLAKIGDGPVNTPERGRGYIAADQQQVGLQFQHHVEFPFGPGKIAGALRLGHAFEIAKRLERANGETVIAAKLADVPGAAVKRQQVILENLDGVEPRGGNGAQLFIEGAAERDGGDRTPGHAIGSMMLQGKARQKGKARQSVGSLLRAPQPRPDARSEQSIR